MTLDRFLNLLVSVTLIEMMLAIGLGVSLAELGRVARNGRLVLGAALANYVCVPAAALGLLLVFQTPPAAATGFLILAACPGAPFGPPITALARGHGPTAVGVMALLAGSSALLAPLVLQILLPFVAGGEGVSVDPLQLVRVLVVTQLAPLGAGLAVRHWRPHWAERMRGGANRLGAVLNLAALVLILATQSAVLRAVPLRGVAGMAVLWAASLGAGWLLGGRTAAERRALGLTCALRNVGLSLVIATAAFPGTPTVAAVLAYGLFEILSSVAAAACWRRIPFPGEAPV